MKSSLVLITSVIDTPKIPLSYTPTRSAFTMEERYEQTKKSIQSIRSYLPNSKIFLIECSKLPEEYKNYITSHVDYFLNIYDEEEKRKHVYSIYKAEGETQLMIDGLKFILDNNLQFDYFCKLSGRYYLTSDFDACKYLFDDKFSFHCNGISINTIFYIMHNKYLRDLLNHLTLNFQNTNHLMYEEIFADFIKKYIDISDKLSYNYLFGVEGIIAINRNDFCKFPKPV